MKDHRTWWRNWEKGKEVTNEMDGAVYLFYNIYHYKISEEMESGCKCFQCDCMYEQLFAIREGMA